MKKNNFSSNVKILRGKTDLNSKDFLDNIGFKRTTWNGYETGNSYPSFSDFIKIAEYFSLSTDDLLYSDLSNVQLNEKGVEGGKGKNVLLNVQPSVQLKGKKAVVNAPLTSSQSVVEMLEKVVQTQEKTIASQEAMIQLLSKRVAELEEINARLQSEIPKIGQPMENEHRDTG